MAEPSGTLRPLVTLAVFAAALAFPFLASGYHMYQGAQVLIFAVALLGLNLLTGFNSQISLGHGAFFAIGGYGTAILMAQSYTGSISGKVVDPSGLPVSKVAIEVKEEATKA